MCARGRGSEGKEFKSHLSCVRERGGGTEGGAIHPHSVNILKRDL